MARIISPATSEVVEIRYLVGEPVSGKALQARITDVLTDTNGLVTKVGTTASLGGGTNSLAGMLVSLAGSGFAATDSLKDIKAETAAIKAKTDALPTDPADQSLVEAAITSAHTTTNNKVDAVQSDVTAIKAKTDNLPANTATTLTSISGKVDTAQGDLTAMKGSGFQASDSLKDIKAAVMQIQNNTSFTASVVPEMIIPASGNIDFHNLVNVYDGTGGMVDADQAIVFVRYEVSHGASRNDHLFDNAARDTAATKLVVYTISDPSVDPTAGAVYKDSANTQFTVIGMAGLTHVIASWTGATAPVLGSGTLTRVSGTGDATLTATDVENNYVAMVNDPGVGQYSVFYNVQSSDAEENLSARFMYFVNGVQRVFDRSTYTVSPANAATNATAVWDVTAASHLTAGTTGKQAADTLTAVNAIKTITDALPNAGALTSLAQDSTVAKASALSSAQSDITAIKTVTDALPNAGALTSLAQASALATVDTVVDGIKAVTDLLPNGGALTSLAQDSTVAKATDLAVVDSNVDAIKLKTDNLPNNTSTRLDSIDSAIAAIKTLPSRVQATKTSATVTQGNTTIIDIDAAAGFNCQCAQLFDFEVVRTTGASTDWNVEVCEKSDGSYVRSKIENITPSDPTLYNLGGQIFVNRDASVGKHIYIKITNNTDAGNSTFTISVRGIVMQDAAA